MERSIFLSAIETALRLAMEPGSTGSPAEFARRACEEWLAYWPGDFRVRMMLGKACMLAGDHTTALSHLRHAVTADPEWTDPYRELIVLERKSGNTAEWTALLTILNCISLTDPLPTQPSPWADSLRESRRLAERGRWQESRLAAEVVLRSAADSTLPAVLHLRAMVHLADFASVFTIGREYRNRWPACSALVLLMAQACFTMGKNAEAVELLHTASMIDPASEVANRYLGTAHAYRPLWPAVLKADIRTSIPSEVILAAGWNQLPQGVEPIPDSPPDEGLSAESEYKVLVFPNYDSAQPDLYTGSDSLPQSVPGEKYSGPSGDLDSIDLQMSAEMDGVKKNPEAEAVSDLADLKFELDKLAARLKLRKTIGKKSGLRPAYLTLTSRSRLKSVCGADQWDSVNLEISNFLQSKRVTSGWPTYLLDVDDAEALKQLQLNPVDAANAWEVKHLLAAAADALSRRGERIGTVLILGGHDVIPFHLLPNPADDDDQEVPSDNPYATRDENYFVPEWPVGRIPCPNGQGASFLIPVLRKAAGISGKRKKTIISMVRDFLEAILRPWEAKYRKGFGYTADIWKRASHEVYKGISSPRSMEVSPPVDHSCVPAAGLARSTYAYFNLHGIEHGPQWIGQASGIDLKRPEDEFPIALEPSRIGISGSSPATIFTEACYGANILEKGVEESLALKFLHSGTQVLVGSTKICYGATSTPLIAADLLANLFIKNCRNGNNAGEALRDAKITFTEQMNARQGYLDPEDQKTLMSFILLGDPMFTSEPSLGAKSKKSRAAVRSQEMPRRLFWSKSGNLHRSDRSDLPQKELKKAMRKYLPGMESSRVRILSAQLTESDSKTAGSGKSPTQITKPSWIVSLEKSNKANGHTIVQYARMSMDRSGKVLKCVVSR